MDIPAAAAHPGRPYGGYALTRLREAGDEETLRFEAYLTKDGRKVAHVSNDGHGGAHRYGLTGRRSAVNDPARARAEHRADLEEFEAFAATWNAGTEFAGIEDGDQFVNHLVEVAVLSRKRVVIFLVDDQDYFTDGLATTFPSGVTHDQAVTILRGPRYANRNPRIWSKAIGDFIPVT